MREERTYFVYLLASRPYGTLYIGVTNDLYRRTVEHRDGRAGKFTKKYGVTKLVWFQEFSDIEEAIQREKSMKRWPRAWKINLIERSNPDWHDLFPAMQKYEPKAATFGARIEMGPRDAPSVLRPAGTPEDDS
jgi:putative endonuclease